MEREQAFLALKSRIKNEDILQRSIASEVMMRAFARYFKEDEENWALAGLLHAIDAEKTRQEPEKQGVVAAEILEELGVEDFIIYAIQAHHVSQHLERKRKLDKTLFSVVPLAKFIFACASAEASQQITSLNAATVLARLDERGFAPEIERDQIRACADAGLELSEFIKISLEAVKILYQNLAIHK